ncbi:MAG: transcription termination factor Rho [Leucobacter sp.]
MEQNSNETNPVENTEALVRRRASRRVTAEAGAASETVTTSESSASATESTTAAAPAAAEGAAPAEAAPKKRVTRSRKKVDDSAAVAATPDATTTATNTADAGAAETSAAGSDAGADAAASAVAEAAPKKRVTRSRKKAEPASAESASVAAPATNDSANTAEKSADANASTSADAPAGDAGASGNAESTEKKAPARGGRRAASQKKSDAAQTDSAQSETEKPQNTNGPESASQGAAGDQQGAASKEQGATTEQSDAASIEQSAAADSNDSGRGRSGRGQNGRNQRNRDNNRNDSNRTDNNSSDNAKGDDKAQSENERSDNGGRNNDNSSRSNRTRQRDRKRRGQNDEHEPEITEDDVLLPIAGILDVLDNYAFVRTSGYLPGTGDVYVSLGQVKKYGLRKGDAVVGAIRQPRESDGGGRQKYNAIVKVDAVNGQPFEEKGQERADFADLTPIYPQERLQLETTPENLTGRTLDLFVPVGKGQRVLVTAPPGSGRTTLLRNIAEAVSTNYPEAHLMTLAIGERPEEVTELQRAIRGEVVASTFDRSAEDHTTVADLAIERAKRLVELGHDVVLLVDSLTRLGQAYLQTAPTPNRGVPAPKFDPAVLAPVKRLFGAARNVENGGSLTIVATALTETGSKTDRKILAALAGTANSELNLSQEIAQRRVYPAIDLTSSATYRDELLLATGEDAIVEQLRTQVERAGDADRLEAFEGLLRGLRESGSNAEFLVRRQRTLGAA